MVNVLGHARLLRKRYSGVLHLAMFFGFLFLLTAVVQAFGEGAASAFSLAAIGGHTWIALGQDIFALLLLVAVASPPSSGWSAPHRFVGSNQRDAALILMFILAIVISMLAQSTLHRGRRQFLGAVATAVLGLGSHRDFARYGAADGSDGDRCGFMATLARDTRLSGLHPRIEALHILAAIPNIYMRPLELLGHLATPDLESPRLGVSDIGQFGRKQLLDLYACTECGRCQELCPAYAAGKPLSPKLLIMNLRDHLLDAEGNSAAALIGGAVAEETLWACTTCRACMEACPLLIEHVPKIVDMRRHLAMEAGRVPDGISGAMLSVEQRGHPWAGTPYSRLDWCRDLNVRVLADGEQTDTLLWVGCTAALDARAQKVARALVRLLQTAKLDFAILGDASLVPAMQRGVPAMIICLNSSPGQRDDAERASV